MSLSDAPRPLYRMIPSRFPPVNTFDTVMTLADAQAVLDLEGWTNDRLTRHRMLRIPDSDWVYGSPNSNVVMAAFIHGGLYGSRFNGPELGAWYASTTMETAIVEVAHHLRRDAQTAGAVHLARDFRTYSCEITGRLLDIRGQQATLADVYKSADFSASQKMGEQERANGVGIIYDSVRHAGGVNVVCYRPRQILNIVQTDHYRIAVSTEHQQIRVKKLAA